MKKQRLLKIKKNMKREDREYRKKLENLRLEYRTRLRHGETILPMEYPIGVTGVMFNSAWFLKFFTPSYEKFFTDICSRDPIKELKSKYKNSD